MVAGDAATGDAIRIKSGQAITNAAVVGATHHRGNDTILEAATGAIGGEAAPIFTDLLGDAA